MANISSHVLDSVAGTHAAGIRVECYRRDSSGNSALVFDVLANDQGRISEAVETWTHDTLVEYELVFHSKAYLKSTGITEEPGQIMETIVVRLSLMDADENYHVPIMLAPHSYSVWWSGSQL